MVDLGGGLLHSGLKSSFVTFISTNMVPIEPVNATLSRRSIMQKNIVDFKTFHLKMPSFGRHFCWDKYGRRCVYNWTF